MFNQLKFSQKILLAAAVVVVMIFSLSSLYSYSLQRDAVSKSLENYLDDIGGAPPRVSRAGWQGVFCWWRIPPRRLPAIRLPSRS
ncbi:hypothetical protein G3O07_24050 [Pseudomonas laurentiana]|uniref:Methyl-accepting chemotaxis protein n=1 Tax=Pseudomonas laurentiana TaxID=2364649 RepID=A0A6I5RWS7_9PSED|nr:hypothetical protein [Pseudomonas laurentiana]